MSKLSNFEIVKIEKEDGYVVLETEKGHSIEIELEYLPDNLKEGRFLRFVVSHTDYNPDKEEADSFVKDSITRKEAVPNGRQLSY